MDYSIRIPATPERVNLLEERCASKRDLPKIKDLLFKPLGVSLGEFDPKSVVIRLREFADKDRPSTLAKIKIIKVASGYTDKKESLGEGETSELVRRAKELGYEKWGEISTASVQYELDFGGNQVKVFAQDLVPVGTFLKVESSTQEGLDKALALLSVSPDERIEKNAAVLLIENLNLS